MTYDWNFNNAKVIKQAREIRNELDDRKLNLDVAPRASIHHQVDPRVGRKPQRRRTLKAAMIALVVALVAIVTTSTISWKQRIITAIVAAAIAVSVSLFVPGCMSTTSIDGKEYSWRLDILAPIGATVPKPEWESPAPVIIYATSQPAAQPATTDK